MIVLAACSGDRPAPTGPEVDEAIEIEFGLRLDDLQDRLWVEVHIGNRDALRRNVLMATCNPTVEIYDPADGRLVWSESRRQADTISCNPSGSALTLMPGEKIGVGRELRDADVLGDSLPAGTYRAIAHFTLQKPSATHHLIVENVRLGLP